MSYSLGERMVSFMKSNIADLLTLSKITVNARKISEVITNCFAAVTKNSRFALTQQTKGTVHKNKAPLYAQTASYCGFCLDRQHIYALGGTVLPRQAACFCPLSLFLPRQAARSCLVPSNKGNCTQKQGTLVSMDILT